MNIKPEQQIAAGEIVDLIAEKIGTNRQIHSATAIAAGARLAGSFLFRSFGFKLGDIKPGTAVLSEEANEKGPLLINILIGTLSNMGVELDGEKMDKATNVDSNLSFKDTLEKIQEDAFQIMTVQQLSHEEMAYSCAMATAFIIKECKNDLPVESGFNTAVYGFIEGTKTCPPEMGKAKPGKKSFFKFWK